MSINHVIRKALAARKPSVPECLRRLTRWECPVHGVSMVRWGAFEANGKVYTYLACGLRLCQIAGFGDTVATPFSLWPEFNNLLVPPPKLVRALNPEGDKCEVELDQLPF
ncbi:hypothetical protein GCM10027511_22130 [Hymenobacter humi]